MHYSRLGATAIAVCLASAGLGAQKQLALLATVSTVSGSDAAITATDVRVTENGQPLPVSKLELLPRIPKLQVLIDNGTGIPATSLGDLRNGLKAFLEKLPTGLEVTLITTAPQGRTLQAATTDRAKLASAIDRIVPDSSTGRFVESLLEAMERVDKDKDAGAAYAIVTVATTSGETAFHEADVKKISDLAQRHQPVVFTALVNTVSSANVAGPQIEVGKGLAEMTGGRFESIGLANRLVTLLPEIAATVSNVLRAKQLRVTAERPAGGPMGQIAVDIPGINVIHLALDAARTK
jgi:hypothetical protein